MCNEKCAKVSFMTFNVIFLVRKQRLVLSYSLKLLRDAFVLTEV